MKLTLSMMLIGRPQITLEKYLQLRIGCPKVSMGRPRDALEICGKPTVPCDRFNL